jgi:hypothetical protein
MNNIANLVPRCLASWLRQLTHNKAVIDAVIDAHKFIRTLGLELANTVIII